jgi:hypothetical protein
MGGYFLSYSCRALAVEPTAEEKPVGYGFAPLHEEVRSWTWSDELRETVTSRLPAERASCQLCGRRARFRWCGKEIYADGPYALEFRDPGEYSERDLCGGCAADAFARAVRSAGVVYDEVMPPADDDGFLTTSEV